MTISTYKNGSICNVIFFVSLQLSFTGEGEEEEERALR